MNLSEEIGLDEIWETAVSAAEKEVGRILRDVSRKAKQKSSGKRMTGAFLGSFDAPDVRRRSFGIVGEAGPRAMHGGFAEYDTPPHFPPKEAMERFAREQLGLAGQEAQEAAFLIGRKISRKGTKGAGAIRAAFDAAKPSIANRIADAVGSALD